MATADDLAAWLPGRPLDRDDLAALEARDAVRRAVTVRLAERAAGTFAGGLQIEVDGGLVYLADRTAGRWRVERYTGATAWWLREERADRIDVRD
ncbi:MAG: hypothetical protein ABEJ23_02160 [Haloarculaceae archaeon]